MQQCRRRQEPAEVTQQRSSDRVERSRNPRYFRVSGGRWPRAGRMSILKERRAGNSEGKNKHHPEQSGWRFSSIIHHQRRPNAVIRDLANTCDLGKPFDQTVRVL